MTPQEQLAATATIAQKRFQVGYRSGSLRIAVGNHSGKVLFAIQLGNWPDPVIEAKKPPVKRIAKTTTTATSATAKKPPVKRVPKPKVEE